MITEHSKREPFKLHFPFHYITNDPENYSLSFHLVSSNDYIKDNIMQWTRPQATEMRFGFEVTMYVMNK